MSLMVSSLLKNLSFDFDYRFVGYTRKRKVSHVYVIAYDSRGRQIPIDAVHTDFNEEAPYQFNIDYDPHTQAAVAGLPKSGSTLFTLVKIGAALWLGKYLLTND